MAMIYVLIYWIVGVVVTIIDSFIDYGKEWLKFPWTDLVIIFIIFPIFFPLRLIKRMLDGIDSLTKRKK